MLDFSIRSNTAKFERQTSWLKCVHVLGALFYDVAMRSMLRFFWTATRGHHLRPWRSPYLLWRIETYTGVKMHQMGVWEFSEFVWRERSHLWRFLKWTGEMDDYAHPKPKIS